MSPKELLKAMFKAGVDAALPSLCVPPHLPERPKAKGYVRPPIEDQNFVPELW